MRMGTPSDDRRPVRRAQGNQRMFLQAAHDLHQRKVEGAHFHRDAMQGVTLDHVHIIAPTLDVESLTRNRESIAHFLGNDCDHDTYVG